MVTQSLSHTGFGGAETESLEYIVCRRGEQAGREVTQPQVAWQPLVHEGEAPPTSQVPSFLSSLEWLSVLCPQTGFKEYDKP